MGIDYDAVGGIGVEFTDDMVEKSIELGIFSEDDWEEDDCACMEKLDMLYGQAGNLFTGNRRYYLLVSGETLKEINDNAPEFVDKVSKFLPGLSVDTLQVIEDYIIS